MDTCWCDWWKNWPGIQTWVESVSIWTFFGINLMMLYWKCFCEVSVNCAGAFFLILFLLCFQLNQSNRIHYLVLMVKCSFQAAEAGESDGSGGLGWWRGECQSLTFYTQTHTCSVFLSMLWQYGKINLKELWLFPVTKSVGVLTSCS